MDRRLLNERFVVLTRLNLSCPQVPPLHLLSDVGDKVNLLWHICLQFVITMASEVPQTSSDLTDLHPILSQSLRTKLVLIQSNIWVLFCEASRREEGHPRWIDGIPVPRLHTFRHQ